MRRFERFDWKSGTTGPFSSAVEQPPQPVYSEPGQVDDIGTTLDATVETPSQESAHPQPGSPSWEWTPDAGPFSSTGIQEPARFELRQVEDKYFELLRPSTSRPLMAR